MALIVGALAAAAVCGGYLLDAHYHIVLGICLVVLLVGIFLTDALALPMLAVPATLLVIRAGGGASNLSVSDLILFLGTVATISTFHIREAPIVARLLLVLCFYQSTTLLTVVYNPYRADIVEWFHEALLVGGSLVVGWAIGRCGRARSAIGVYIGGCCGLALWALFFAFTHNLSAASLPFGFQKNYIGDMLAFAALLCYANPQWLRMPSGWRRIAIGITLLGILSAQSKQAIISVAIGMLFVAFRGRHFNRRPLAILVVLAPLIVVAYVTVAHEVASSNHFNSVYQRLTYFQASIRIWDKSKLVGVGLRWWYTSRFTDAFQPPNAEMEMLTSAGVAGLLGLVGLIGGSLKILRRVNPVYGSLAFAAILVRIVQGQLDIFWVAAQGSIPWLIVGISLGVLALDVSSRPPMLSADSSLLKREFGLP